jgi:ankyrin repeat protein
MAMVPALAACVALLLAKGAQRDVRERAYGASPLHIAAGQGHCECVRALLEVGADAAARRRAEPAAHPDGAPFRSEVEPCADPALVDAPLLAAELIVLTQRIERAAAP